MALVLAVRLLFHDLGRLATALGGIAIAVLLMLVQLGFRNAIFDSSLQLVSAFDADLVVENKMKRALIFPNAIPEERLHQAQAVAGVAAAYPIWITNAPWKDLATNKQRPMRLIGVRPGDPVWADPDLRAAAASLDAPDTVLVDRRSRPEYGALAPGPAQLGRRSVRVTGTFAIGSDFVVDGNAVAGRETFHRISHRPEGRIELVLIKAAPGVDPASLVAPLRAALPGDVTVNTVAGVRERDLTYWAVTSPIGLVMGVGMFLGFLAGIGIVYQILFAQIADYLKEFATLRAIGWGGPSIVAVVLYQALVLAFVGYLPSVAAGLGIYAYLSGSTGLPMTLTPDRAATVLGLTALMCLVAGLLAVRRLLDANPADLFS